jgi:hypothetical protein
MNISTCISNVPGPDFPLYCAGARMVDYYGLGVLTPGMGIFHLVFSYSGKITLSVLADRDIMPDPEYYHDLLVASYQEIYRAALETEAAGAGPAADLEVVSPKRDTGRKAAPGLAVSAKPKPPRKLPAKAKAGSRATPARARPLPKAKPAKKTPGKGPRAKARPRRAASSR